MNNNVISRMQLRTDDSKGIEGTGPDILDMERVHDHLQRGRATQGMDAETYLYKNHCLVNEGGTVMATLAGIMCFGRAPQDIFPHATVNIAHYYSDYATSLRVRHIERRIGGTIFDQMEFLENYIKRHIQQGMTVDRGFERRDIFQYPLVVLRELTVNMLAHRDYIEDTNSVSHVRMYTNHIEWYNPGGLPDGLTVDDLMTMQRSRNPRIFDILNDRGLIEGVGQGVDTVVSTLKLEGLRPAKFELPNGNFFMVTVYGREAPPDPLRPRLTERQESILAVVNNRKSVSSADILKLLSSQGTTVTYRSLMRELGTLQDLGLISSSGGSRNTRYHITRSAPLSER